MEPQRKLIAEFVGTFTLIFIGAGAGLVGGGDIVSIGLANGLAIGLMVTAVGHISGGHFNPAVTLAMLVTGRIEVPEAIRYWIAQLTGALAAALVLLGALGTSYRKADAGWLGTPGVGSTFDTKNALIAEIVATFFLVFVIFGVAVDKRGAFKTLAGLPIGLMITIDVFAIGGVSGGAMNPARWFGPALVSFHFDDFWVWIVGPGIGALLAAFVYDNLLLRGTPGE